MGGGVPCREGGVGGREGGLGPPGSLVTLNTQLVLTPAGPYVEQCIDSDNMHDNKYWNTNATSLLHKHRGEGRQGEYILRESYLTPHHLTGWCERIDKNLLSHAAKNHSLEIFGC